MKTFDKPMTHTKIVNLEPRSSMSTYSNPYKGIALNVANSIKNKYLKIGIGKAIDQMIKCKGYQINPEGKHSSCEYAYIDSMSLRLDDSKYLSILTC